MKWTVIVGCILTLLFPAASVAQDVRPINRPDNDLKTEQVNSRPLLDAAVRAAKREGGSAVGLSQQLQQRSWRSRHPVKYGTIIGAGAGSVIAPITFLSATGTSDAEAGFAIAPTFAIIGAGTGAGVGALTGWIVSIARR